MRTPLVPYVLALLVACGPSEDPEVDATAEQDSTPSEAAEPASSTTARADGDEDAVEVLRTAIDDVAERDEHDSGSVEVAHILVGVKSPRPRMQAFEYTAEEAEVVAADLYQRILAGEDFLELMKAHSDDPGPGVYPMTKASRSGMVPGFGNTAWRLEVGEVGIAAPHPKDSPFGYHIIKRLE